MADVDRTPVLIIGLGRFGSAVAERLIELGNEVLAIDSDALLVQRSADRLTHVVQADATDEETLRQLGVGEFARAIVAIGSHVEASILVTSLLSDLGIPTIWAKAVSAEHGRILGRVGAHHVVFPEVDMGRRMAGQVDGSVIDTLDLGDGWAVAETHPPRALVGKRARDVRRISDVSVLAVKHVGGDLVPSTDDDHVLDAEDVVVVSGRADRVDRFSRER